MTIDLGLFESRIEHEAVYPHPRERVWRALTESDILAAWLMDNDLEDVAVGETFEFRGESVPLLWDGTVQCEILAVEPPERLEISWNGGGMNPATTVTWRLEDVEEGTRLIFTHEGLDGLRGLLMKGGLSGGWQTMYEQTLPELLDTLTTHESISSLGPCDPSIG